MSEVGSKPPKPELIAMLPEGCRECFVALEGLKKAHDTEEEMIVVQGIAENCSGWTAEEPPHESFLHAEGSPEFRKASVISLYCPYAQVPENPDPNS